MSGHGIRQLDVARAYALARTVRAPYETFGQRDLGQAQADPERSAHHKGRKEDQPERFVRHQIVDEQEDLVLDRQWVGSPGTELEFAL